MSVTLQVRHLMTRKAFSAGTFEALLVDASFEVLGTTRNHKTWHEAALAALRLADRRGILVDNRPLVLRRVAEGK